MTAPNASDRDEDREAVAKAIHGGTGYRVPAWDTEHPGVAERYRMQADAVLATLRGRGWAKVDRQSEYQDALATIAAIRAALGSVGK